MRAPVTNATSVDIAHGPGSFLIKNMTATADVFLETANTSLSGVATVAAGFQWQATDPPVSINLNRGESLYAIVNTGGAAQSLHVLSTAMDAIG